MISHLGFVKKTTSFNLKKSINLDFVLDEDYYELEEITVSNQSKKRLETTSAGKISFNPKNISEIPSLMGSTDIIKLLQLTPGVQNSGDANGYLYVRGGDPGHNLMLYAETPVYGMAHLLGIFPFYNATHLNEVQFDKSNSNAKYGGRLSSTVSAVSNQMIPQKISVEGNLGLLATQATVSVPLGKKSGFYISGRKTYIDEIITPVMNINKKRKDSDVDDFGYGFTDGNFTFISEINQKNNLVVDAFISGDVFKAKDNKLNLNTHLKWDNMVLNTKWKHQFSNNVTMTNAVYFSRYSNTLLMNQSEVQINTLSTIQDIGFTNSFLHKIKEIPFESGLQLSAYQLQPQKINISNLGIDNNQHQDLFIKSQNLALFTSAKPKLADKLYAELGLRFNYYTSGINFKPLLRLEPRMVLNYYPYKNQSLFVSYTRQNQFLNLITTSSIGIPTDFWVATTKDIPSQSCDQFAVGYNLSFKNKFSTSVGGFYRLMKDLIEYPYSLTQFNEVSSFKNDILTGDGKSYGLESILKKESGRWKGWVSYTLSWSIRQFDDLNNGEPFYAKYDRRHNLSFVSTYDLGSKWNFGLTQIFSSGNRFTMPTSWYFLNNNPIKEYSQYNNAQMPNYIRTDISCGYSLIKSAKRESVLIFSVYNTFNIENPVYLVLSVSNDILNNLKVKTDKKTLYTILPSISWRFKF